MNLTTIITNAITEILKEEGHTAHTEGKEPHTALIITKPAHTWTITINTTTATATINPNNIETIDQDEELQKHTLTLELADPNLIEKIHQHIKNTTP